MANIAGTFFDVSPGTLRVALIGTFQQGSTSRDAGFPSGFSDMLLIGVVNGNPTPAISRYSPTTYLELAYPGNVSWAVSTQVLATQTGSGVQSAYGFKDLKMVLQLLKK